MVHQMINHKTQHTRHTKGEVLVLVAYFPMPYIHLYFYVMGNSGKNNTEMEWLATVTATRPLATRQSQRPSHISVYLRDNDSTD